MSKLQDEVRAIVRHDGVVSRRDEPQLRATIDWLIRTGELAAVLPGVYTAAGQTDTSASACLRFAGGVPMRC